MKCDSIQMYFNPADKKWHLDAILSEESIAQGKTIAEHFAGEIIDLTVERFAKKRTLTANAYYWVLNGKLAKAIGVSKSRMHNILLRRYGVPEVVNEDLVYAMIPDTEDAENQILESETYHLKPTSNIKEGKDGIDRRGYILLKGSSQMDTNEMAALIDGTVDECHQVGIETMTPRELNELYEMERNRNGKCK